MMRKIFTKEQILTIPNLLSLLRLCMIPLIVWLYSIKGEYYWAAAVIILSGLTDIADGIIARKCNMISDFGKMLDPVADKLTQGIVIICLALRYPFLWVLVGLFAAKEICMIIVGIYVIKKIDEVNGAKVYGKITTVVLYLVMMILILFPSIELFWVNILLIICIFMVVMSFMMYLVFYKKLLKRQKAQVNALTD